MKKALIIISKILGKIVGGVAGGILLTLIELFIDSTFSGPPEITSTNDAPAVYIMYTAMAYFSLLLFNIVYCLVYVFVNTKKNRWYLIVPYILAIISFYLSILP